MAVGVERIDRLCEALGREGRVTFAYLFGSAVGADGSGAADLDVAVWLVDGPEARRWAYRSLLPDLMVAAGTDAVDLTVLNTAPPALRFVVQKTGEPIYDAGDAGRASRLAFEQRARKDYWDLLPRLKVYARFLGERLKRGEFGA